MDEARISWQNWCACAPALVSQLLLTIGVLHAAQVIYGIAGTTVYYEYHRSEEEKQEKARVEAEHKRHEQLEKSREDARRRVELDLLERRLAVLDVEVTSLRVQQAVSQSGVGAAAVASASGAGRWWPWARR